MSVGDWKTTMPELPYDRDAGWVPHAPTPSSKSEQLVDDAEKRWGVCLPASLRRAIASLLDEQRERIEGLQNACASSQRQLAATEP